MRRTELGGSDVAGSVTVNNQKPQQVDPHGVGECGATNANSLSRKAVYHEDTKTRLHDYTRVGKAMGMGKGILDSFWRGPESWENAASNARGRSARAREGEEGA
ncbi:hypothetical protein E4U35_007083 [Claviceps purpurea]|nr:hypothetical protein E4U12_004170 [Claviceps purpurea]KAG6168400.1 hypothetical protein E4U51_002219 [Claviceps purpurea]KAG6198419.1 hypothetical protein E4U35_007083 [Claviceps purpurea]KAG6242600.1 hypothetical protein E4U23_006787 [Claviceps purpurea]KAG6292294.1 hypothetical protein E4U46_000338 [Claviceps purpurea]